MFTNLNKNLSYENNESMSLLKIALACHAWYWRALPGSVFCSF
jgi:hypothetical protein